MKAPASQSPAQEPTKINQVEQLSFEQAVAELESLVEKLNHGTIPLEQALEDYERGRILLEHCQKTLQKAERRIQVWSKQGLQDYSNNSNKSLAAEGEGSDGR